MVIFSDRDSVVFVSVGVKLRATMPILKFSPDKQPLLDTPPMPIPFPMC